MITSVINNTFLIITHNLLVELKYEHSIYDFRIFSLYPSEITNPVVRLQHLAVVINVTSKVFQINQGPPTVPK